MSEHDIRQSNQTDAGSGVRSHLLTPIMEGTSEAQNNVVEFLAGRLSAASDFDAYQVRTQLS